LFLSSGIVAAVADGIKAWNTLKEKSNNIDLVLTEVELPFLSGFGLLTMIMEHDICKNIPVISMISTLLLYSDLLIINKQSVIV
jgi:pseudo-response regulator 5